MRKRAVQLTFVDPQTNEKPSTPQEPHFDKKAETIGRIFEKGVEKVGAAIIGYVVVDTIRKVIIAKAEK